MKLCFFPLMGVLVVLWGCTSQTAGNKKETPTKTGWDITTDNAKIEFVGAKPEGKHDGGFKSFSGKIDLPQDVSMGKISLTIDTASLWSDNKEKLTPHLKSPDFFDVKNHPKAEFASTKIAEDKGDGKTHSVTGDLTLHGKTKSITVPVTITRKDRGMKLTSDFTINRLDHDIGAKFPATKIHDGVKIKITLDTSK